MCGNRFASSGLGIRILDKEIGIVEKQSASRPDVPPMFRYESAWGNVPRPRYRCDVQEITSSNVGHLSNPCTVNKKFFWPNMTNGKVLNLCWMLSKWLNLKGMAAWSENIDGQHRKHPMVLQLPSRFPR
jgi:hypothetical protein